MTLPMTQEQKANVIFFVLLNYTKVQIIYMAWEVL